MRYWIFVISFLLLPVGAYVALAAPEGLVPCKGAACQACDLVKLGNNIISWLIRFGVLVAVVIVAWAGVKLVTSGGSSEAVGKAKSMIWSALVGFILLLACYLLVDIFMKTLTRDPQTKQSMGVAEWTAKFCEDTSSKTSTSPTTSGGDRSSYTQQPTPKPPLEGKYYSISDRHKIPRGAWCFTVDSVNSNCSTYLDVCKKELQLYLKDDTKPESKCFQIPW